MGCSCTKGEAGGSNKNGLGRGYSKESLNNLKNNLNTPYERNEAANAEDDFKNLGESDNLKKGSGADVDGNGDSVDKNEQADTATSILPAESIISTKRRLNNSLLRPFAHLFKENRSSADLHTNFKPVELDNHQSSISLLSPNVTAKINQSSQVLSTPVVSSRQTNVNSKQQILNSTDIYSFQNLPLKTQHLLNAQRDFDSTEVELERIDASTPTGIDKLKHHLNKSKTNREIQIYLSTPFNNNQPQNTSNPKTDVGNVDLTFGLFNSRYSSYANNLNTCSTINSVSSNETLFSHLRSYCAQQINNCDLNLIDLNNPTSTNQNSKNNNNTNNKYFKRLLSKSILSDLLNISVRKCSHNYSSSCFLFVIFLSDTQFEEDEKAKNLLCPDEIELLDYEKYLEPILNEADTILFKKWYTKTSDPTRAFRQHFYKLNEHFLFDASLFAELDTLFNILNEKFEQINNENNLNEDSNNNNNNSINNEYNSAKEFDLKLKYFKSIQQEEIELVVKYLDPASVIWFNLTHQFSFTQTNNSAEAKFNFIRYKTVLDLLQSHVLAHNYKECVINEHDLRRSFGRMNSASLSNHHTHSILSTNEKSMNEFLYNSIKSLIDNYISELNKKQSNNIALKIDKQLAQEIYKHYEYYKYLKIQHQILDQKLPLRKTVQNEFDQMINEYLNEKTSSNRQQSPLILYHLNEYNNNSNTNSDINYECSSDELICKWLASSIKQSKENQLHVNRNVIYRFCSHTILSDDLSTLIQSVLHQICYLLDIHESWSFDCPSNLVENFLKALEKNKPAENKEKNSSSDDNEVTDQLVIILDRMDRLIHNEYDQKFFICLLDKLYNNNGPAHFNFKLILTFSFDSDTEFLTKLKQPIKQLSSVDEKCIRHLKLNTNTNNNTEAKSVKQLLVDINQNLFKLFDVNNLKDVNKLGLLEVLLSVLKKTRYGLKQCEIVDLLRLYFKSHQQFSTNNHLYLDHLILITWYTFKNYTLIQNETNFIQVLVDNNQTLYRLKKIDENTCELLCNETDTKLNSLLTTFYQSVIDRNSCQAISSNRLFVSYLVNRAYQELPGLSYLNYSQQQPQQLNSKLSAEQFYSNNFMLNYKWLLNKSLNTGNVLYYLHDLEKYRKTLLNLENNNLNEDFDEFSKLIYKIVYSLYQDPNQLFSQLKTRLKLRENSPFLSNLLNDLNKACKLFTLPLLDALNYDTLIKSYVFDDGNNEQLIKEKTSFNTLEAKLTFFSKVTFLGSNLIMAMSESHNEIKIWRIVSNCEGSSELTLIRSIKLNRAPRDLRLLNKHTAVVLVERNLHLFDLNKCEHVLDMNSTMSANVPFFEIHDQNHVVFLARNRLSVILMKISASGKSKELSNGEEASAGSSSGAGAGNYTADNMFLFKVGEDRYLNSLLVSRNGQVMVCGDEVQKPFPLLVWNLDKRKLVYDLRQAKHEFVTAIQAIGSSGRFVVCACQEEGETKNCLIVYDLSTGQLFKKLKAKVSYVAVEISEESNVVIACLENAQVIIYDLSNGSKKFTLNSNRYPINKIKILDSHKSFKNYFVTYDTKGYDWTIRLWDLNKGDCLISSFTCPSRIVSCNFNTAPLFFDHKTKNEQDLLIGVALYGLKELLLIKIVSNKKNHTSSFASSHSNNNNSEKIHHSNSSDVFCGEDTSNFLHKEINL